MGVGLGVPGRQPGPRAQLRGAGETGDVADLGHEHRGEDRADTADGLDRLVAAMLSEHVDDQGGEAVDLGAEGVDQGEKGIDPEAVGVRQARRRRARTRPVTPNRSVAVTATPSLANTACTWAFNPARTATSLAR